MAAGGGGRSRGGSGAPTSLRDLYGSPGRSGAGARNGSHADAGSPRTRAPPGVLRGLPGCGGAGGRAGTAEPPEPGRADGSAEARAASLRRGRARPAREPPPSAAEPAGASSRLRRGGRDEAPLGLARRGPPAPTPWPWLR